MPGPPASDEALAGATLIVNVSASPYHARQGAPSASAMLVQRARDNLCAVAFCNLVGGQDELVFDGHSLRGRPRGRRARPRAAVRRGAASSRRVDLQAALDRAAARHAAAPAGAQRAARGAPRSGASSGAERPSRSSGSAATSPSCSSPRPRSTRRSCSALRDYVEKNGFEHVVLGLSGGIDSTLVALVAVDALGADRVHVRRDAVALLLRGHAARRARARRQPRRRAARAPDRAGDGGLRRDARRAASRAASPTSPRRTCRRASAATC